MPLSTSLPTCSMRAETKPRLMKAEPIAPLFYPRRSLALQNSDDLASVVFKSGSARVVLTIRPGFERDFVSFLVLA